jgi:hypothetical protein
MLPAPCRENLWSTQLPGHHDRVGVQDPHHQHLAKRHPSVSTLSSSTMPDGSSPRGVVSSRTTLSSCDTAFVSNDTWVYCPLPRIPHETACNRAPWHICHVRIFVVNIRSVILRRRTSSVFISTGDVWDVTLDIHHNPRTIRFDEERALREGRPKESSPHLQTSLANAEESWCVLTAQHLCDLIQLGDVHRHLLCN